MVVGNVQNKRFWEDTISLFVINIPLLYRMVSHSNVTVAHVLNE
jgi:hypothetical protein